MYDISVSEPFCTTGLEVYVNSTSGVENYTADDCGSPLVAIIYSVSFQLFTTFAVLNVIIAIILGAFTWCYSLEQGELTQGLPITADNFRHFKQIWDRFDLYSTGRIDISHFKTFLVVLQWNIPTLFKTGERTQNDSECYSDYASWGLQTTYDDPGCLEALEERRCKKQYDDLVVRLGRFERSTELWAQLDAAGCDILMGCNDNVAGFDTEFHPLGSVSDADLHIFTKEINNGIIHVPTFDVNDTPPSIEVLKVTFSSLIRILAMAPLHLDQHDMYVCYGFKDPFSYFQPGYFKDKQPVDSKVCLNTDPDSIEPPSGASSLPCSTPRLALRHGLLHIEPADACEDTSEIEYRFTTDGSTPTRRSSLYKNPVSILARAFRRPHGRNGGHRLNDNNESKGSELSIYTDSSTGSPVRTKFL